MKTSIIIPTLNEAGIIEKTLIHARRHEPHEIIISDGGSRDNTLAIAKKYGTRVVTGQRGRAAQMNAAALEATGDVLVFLHADSTIEPSGYEKMAAMMQNGDLAGGAFSLAIESDKTSLMLISTLATWRAKYLQLAYGDQAIFVRNSVFKKIGGYSPIPICEDLDFYRKLRKSGNTVILDETVVTSARRWLDDGILLTTFRNILIATLFLIGCSPHSLSQWDRNILSP